MKVCICMLSHCRAFDKVIEEIESYGKVVEYGDFQFCESFFRELLALSHKLCKLPRRSYRGSVGNIVEETVVVSGYIANNSAGKKKAVQLEFPFVVNVIVVFVEVA